MSLGIITSCGSTKSIYTKEVRERFKETIGETRIITENDLLKLPKPVAHYLRYCGWVGKEVPKNFYCQFDGPFYLKRDKPMNFDIKTQRITPGQPL
jgi:hypothetical protein